MAVVKFLLTILVLCTVKSEEILSESTSEPAFTYRILNLTAEEINSLQKQAKFFELEAKKELVSGGNKAFACGVSNTKSDRIAGGYETIPNEFPWQARLIFYSGSYQIQCGGTLISDRWVLTAAQCILGSSGAQVILGSHYQNPASDTNRRVYTTSRHVKHPNFNTNGFEADIALVELSTTVPLSNYVRPICLPPTSDSNHVNDRAVISGWGNTYGTGDGTSSTLRKTTVTVISKSTCSSTFGSAITDNKICTSGSNYQGICKGDGGGPLSYVKSNGEHMQIGIISFSSSYGCSYGHPSGYTRIRPYMSWISSITGIETSAAMVGPGTNPLLLTAAAFIIIVGRFF